MIEIYKDIEGYAGLYQISNHGNVKSLNKRKGRMLKNTKDHFGYLRVNLYKDFKYKIHKVHRLVAQAFIPNPNNLTEINHKDEDKTNNKVDNLEWCTPKYNVNFGTAIQRRVENRDYKALATKLCKQVLCVETGKIYPSTMEVQRQFGFNNSGVSAVCLGKCKTYKGYHWEYV